MEQGTRQDRVLIRRGEISCLIGHLFSELEPPCQAEAAGEITITGTTHSGKRGTLAITGEAFCFIGEQEDIIKATEKTCPHKRSCPVFEEAKE